MNLDPMAGLLLWAHHENSLVDQGSPHYSRISWWPFPELAGMQNRPYTLSPRQGWPLAKPSGTVPCRSSFSRAALGTNRRFPTRITGISPRRTASYAEVRPMPRTWAASWTVKVRLSGLSESMFWVTSVHLVLTRSASSLIILSVTG